MLEYIIKGGSMMFPLVACSIVAVAVLIDRAWAFHSHKKYDTRSLRAKVLELVAAGRAEDACRVCAGTPGPLPAVLLAGLQSYLKHKDVKNRPESITSIMKEAMEDYTQHAMSAVEKRLPVLQTVGSAAPLFGMTGTVTGMIAAFGAMSNLGALSGPKVASGIAEALITTAAGLLIALAAVIPYHMFVAMATRIELEIDEAAGELLDCVATKATQE